MKRLAMYTLAMIMSLSVWATGPQYANKHTKEVIEKMIGAHGGLENWKNAETFSFDNIMFTDMFPNKPFWISQITVEQKTRNVYQEWPLHESSMASNGKLTWSENWNVGNPPKFEALFFYYFLNLPWLTQDNNVKLSEATKIKHDAFENEVYIIEMGFTEKPAIGKTKIDKYKLYIDSETYLLVGYEYMLGYGHMLDLMGVPADKKLMGPMFRINDEFTEVNGLIYPNRMHTGNLDQTTIYGHHAIINYKLGGEFDSSKMEMPKDAVLDDSSYKREAK